MDHRQNTRDRREISGVEEIDITLGVLSDTQRSQNAVCDRQTQPVLSRIRNSKIWGGCCDAQSPMHPDLTRDHREVRTVVLVAALPLCARKKGDG